MQGHVLHYVMWDCVEVEKCRDKSIELLGEEGESLCLS